MHLDFHLLYPSVFISGVLDSQISVEEKDDYHKEQQNIRDFISQRNTYRRQMLLTSDKEEKQKLNELQYDCKVAVNTTISRSKWLPMIQAKGREVVNSLEEYLQEQGCEVTSTDIDGVTISQYYDPKDACRYIQSKYGNSFRVESE